MIDPDQKRKIETDLIWKLIVRFQDEREIDDRCIDREAWSDVIFSYNDIEYFLYEVLSEIDPLK